MAKVKLRPLPKDISVIEVAMVALFFSEKISYVISKLKKREKLREFLQINCETE
jgi:hypothetical protein